MRLSRQIPVWLGVLVVTALVMVLYANSAYAADPPFEGFRCVDGRAQGSIYVGGESCPTTLGMSNVFSFLICNMEQLSTNLMGHMYCGMVKSLTPSVWLAATLAVIVFGISFTIGVIPASGRDAMVFLLKITMVTGFATNADLLIGYGYGFLVSAMKNGVEVVLHGMGGTHDSTTSVYAAIDKLIATAFHFATDNMKDPELAGRCKNALFAVMGTIAIAFPLLAYLALMLLARIALTVIRAAFGYVYALVGITFLLTLAPIFLSFYLFKVTSSFYDKWLGYLVSFALQVLLLFACLAFMLSIDVKTMTSSLSEIIVYNAETKETTSFRFPWEYCSLCDFNIVDKETGVVLSETDKDFIARGKLQCKDTPPKPIAIDSMTSPTSSKQLSPLLKLAGEGFISLILLAVIVERLLAQIPYIAQRLASGMGASYAPQVGNQAIPGQKQMEAFGHGFTRGMGVYNAKGGVNFFGGGQGTGVLKGVRDGFAVMLTGKTPEDKGEGNGGFFGMFGTKR